MKKIIGLSIFMSICVFVGAVLMPEETEPKISSAARRFIIGPEEEAIYLVSASDEVSIPEMETVSGNAFCSLSMEAF